jgi:hypothetical protein
VSFGVFAQGWQQGPYQVAGGGGAITTARVLPAADGGALVVWAEQRAGRLGGYWAEVCERGQVGATGRLAPDAREYFDPRAYRLATGTRVVLLSVNRADGHLDLVLVNDAQPLQPDWRHRLGLDPENPLADALFRLVGAFFGALFLALLALPAVGAGVIAASLLAHVFRLPEGRLGVGLSHLWVYAVVVLSKRPGSWLYFHPLPAPPPYHLPAALLAALVALAVAGRERGRLGLLFGGYVFAVLDITVSMVARALVA